jgi:hypothetical protein
VIGLISKLHNINSRNGYSTDIIGLAPYGRNR